MCAGVCSEGMQGASGRVLAKMACMKERGRVGEVEK